MLYLPSQLPSTDKKIYNTHLLISQTGEIKATYNKTHLFDVDIKGGVRLKETDFTVPGASIGPPVDTPVGKVGLAIVCFLWRGFNSIGLLLYSKPCMLNVIGNIPSLLHTFGGNP